jgi:hypothetical protein
VPLGNTCAACGRPRLPGRHFCDCSAALEPAGPIEATATPAYGSHNSLVRRIRGNTVDRHGDNRNWNQRARDVGATAGLRYGSELAAQTRYGRILLALLMGAGLIALLGPLRSQAGRIPGLFSATEQSWVDEAGIDGFPPALMGNDAETASAELLEMPWPFDGGVFRFDPVAETGERRAADCEVPPTELVSQRQTLLLDQAAASGSLAPPIDALTINGTFGQPTDLAELWFQVGPTRGQLDQPWAQPVERPAEIVAVAYDAQGSEVACKVLPLVDSSERQVFEVEADGVTRFTILVSEVWAGGDGGWPVAPLVLVADVSWVEG